MNSSERENCKSIILITLLLLCASCLTNLLYFFQELAPTSARIGKLNDTAAGVMSHTIVTAFFNISSKHSEAEYLSWMSNMLSLQDSMVIFTETSTTETIKRLRSHALHRTLIVKMEIGDLPVAKRWPLTFWEKQLNVDPEKSIHKSYQLFWIWLSKAWFVSEAIRLNPFSSEIFVWSDIGCFRDSKYYGKLLVIHPEMIPKKSLLISSTTQPAKPVSRWVIKAIHDPINQFFVSGSMLAGRTRTWKTFIDAFTSVLQDYVRMNLFIGEDQVIIQTVCMQHSSLCAFVALGQANGDRYFGLQDVLHSRGNILYRDAPFLFWLPTEKAKKRGILCTLIKDENEAVLKSWIEHHERLGFDIVFYDNHPLHHPNVTPNTTVRRFPDENICSQIDTSRRCIHLKECLDWQAGSSRMEHGYSVCQRAAYADCLDRYGAHYTWLGNWDVDEYVFRVALSNTSVAEPPLVDIGFFWANLERSGDGIQLQCLKFGNRQKDNSTFPGDISKHLWRAPYRHIDGVNGCNEAACESIGNEKMLSRTSLILQVGAHRHDLVHGAKSIDWHESNGLGIRCHHFPFHSNEHDNVFLKKQVASGVFEKDSVMDTSILRSYDSTQMRETDSNTSLQVPKIADICVAFLSCRRLDKLKVTYDAWVHYMARAGKNLRFTMNIVDNGSGQEVQDWIRKQQFNRIFLLDRNVGIAKAMDILWSSCDSHFILSLEDDWVINSLSPFGVLEESMHILNMHDNVLEVWLRTHAPDFQYEPSASVCKNGHMKRENVVKGVPLSYYIQTSSKLHFPWLGQYTNGASLKHAERLKGIGPMFQEECGDEGNCVSEFTAKAAYLGLKAARLCWRGDECNVTADNEPNSHVMFVHQSGIQSAGHKSLRTTPFN